MMKRHLQLQWLCWLLLVFSLPLADDHRLMIRLHRVLRCSLPCTLCARRCISGSDCGRRQSGEPASGGAGEDTDFQPLVAVRDAAALRDPAILPTSVALLLVHLNDVGNALVIQDVLEKIFVLGFQNLFLQNLWYGVSNPGGARVSLGLLHQQRLTLGQIEKDRDTLAAQSTSVATPVRIRVEGLVPKSYLPRGLVALD